MVVYISVVYLAPVLEFTVFILDILLEYDFPEKKFPENVPLAGVVDYR